MHHAASLAVLLACAAGATSAAAGVTEDLRCRETAFSRAAEARDASLFAGFIDPEARFVGEPVLRGPAQVVAAWAVFFEPGGPAIRWRPQIVEVLEQDGLALTSGPYRVDSRDDEGNPVERWGTFNSVWRRGEDGVWRVVFDAGGPAAAREPTPEVRALLDTDDCGGAR